MTDSLEKMLKAVAASLLQRSGKSLEQWLVVVNHSGIDVLDQNAVRRWLKAEHGLLQNSQWAIADAAARAAGWQAPSLEEYIELQYSGAKAPLKPVFEHLRQIILSLGDDIKEEGRSSYIPFIAKRQFAAIAAATKTRIDVGLRFSDTPQSDLLSVANAPGQASHKLMLSGVDDINQQVRDLLMLAYRQNQ